MQEIVIILSSLVGVATAAAVRKMPRDKNQLLSLGASSHIKSQITTLKIEKDILTKTISRLYQTDSEFSKIQKDKLLLKYQHQLGIILAKLEKLEQASKHPDLGPVGDGLITLMDQKLSNLDDRLYELSSKITSAKIQTPEIKKEQIKQKISESIKETFNFETSKDVKIKPIEIPATRSRQSFELTTLTNVPRKEIKFPSFEKEEIKQVVKPMPQPKIIQTELIKPKEKIIQEVITPRKEIITPKQKVEDKIEIIQSVTSKLEIIPDIKKEVAKINEHKALPEPKLTTFDDDFDEDGDDLDKIKGDIMKVLSKLDQAEVE
ncbi:MAG: hypothetical protein COA77_02850 [Thaumarchaeota archaeon]|nr:MAG: hypothetical protein COA77_04820 [Nitrososphaerota archaeon]PBO85541.1 MAG: hypothetical protein COA77_02850 [Nitrososphaerota archaeon]